MDPESEFSADELAQIDQEFSRIRGKCIDQPN